MNSIGLVTKLSDPMAIRATSELTEWLNKQHRRVTVTAEAAKAANISPKLAAIKPLEDIGEGQDLVIVLGGDGTFIGAARDVLRWKVPVLGVNMGRLGFLTEVSYDEMYDNLKEVFAGHYNVEDRMMLTAFIRRESGEVLSHHVLNDVVAHKGHLARMMEFQVSINGQHVFTSRADGLIVATPTGSTGYSLSAGGPIIHPRLDTIIINPICPHTLSNRPIAVPGDGQISFRLTQNEPDRLLTLDGQTGVPLLDGDEIVIRKSDRSLRVIHSPDRNYYDILRKKLHWAETVGTKRDLSLRPADDR
ncbi:NAD(+) kinase [Magnetococcus marinus MC-1]|uniref:NAD kinase n=1 Tax=Magnetococcus marinus (strain ATCC BAA-1437 / JCM 17883 / MC-1) TaxID=156889 RepID=NADK_MAGMM|nr:NAD(+)/NADH kinase [Magnetococcus marinus]A0L8H9.1 RecName: Full=NAD kinase; AltName: Full=ATP-dependent NAD kinase [Magnetococcus marinus MC-1]ABK44272.1 NAD(+) kinase [Magnetococcus marinus MC-1]